MTSNPLSLFSKLAAFSVQQPGCGYTDALISALRNKEGDKLTEAKKDDPSCVLSSELPYVIREVSDNEIQPESTPQARPVTRRESRISSYTWPTVLEPPLDYESALDKSLVEYAINTLPAGQGVPVSTSRRSFTKTADRQPMRTSTSGTGAIVLTKPQWGVTKDNEIPDLSTFNSIDSQDRGYPTPPLRRTGIQLSDQVLPRAGPIGSGGGQDYPLRYHGFYPTSPPGGVLRHAYTYVREEYGLD